MVLYRECKIKQVLTARNLQSRICQREPTKEGEVSQSQGGKGGGRICDPFSSGAPKKISHPSISFISMNHVLENAEVL